MKKSEAIHLLGGNIASAAKAIGISYQAVSKWPDELSPKIQDRVTAALARGRLGSDIHVDEAAELLTKQGQAIIDSLPKSDGDELG